MEHLGDHAVTGGERADAIEHCLAGIARLSSDVQDASSFLPAYDQRTYGEAIKALSNKLQQVRSNLAPRPKFSFKSTPTFTVKKNASAISLQDAAELANQRRRQVPGYQSSEESSVNPTPVGVCTPNSERTTESGSIISKNDTANYLTIISDRNGEVIDSTNITTDAALSGTFANLHRCVVDMSGSMTNNHSFATLTLKNITDSMLICGHVSGAVHITNVKNSIIVVASRQFRMHESRKCDVYLHASSRPIIEDCTEIRFGPLPPTFSTSSDDQMENQFRHVDDFKWLRTEASPNWSILESTLDESEWKSVSDGERRNVDEILKAVRIE